MPQYEVSVPGKGTFSVSSPTELTDQQVWLAVQRQLNAPEPPPPPPKPEGGFFPSAKRGFLQTQMLIGDVLPAMFGKAIGAEEYAKKQWEEAAETQKRIEREVPAAVPSYKDISSFGDAWMYAKEAVGESLASIIPSLLTGGAAGLLARPAVAAANTAAREAAEKTLMSAALRMGPPTQVALESAKKAAVQAGIDAAKRTAFRYEVAGGLAGSALQNIPEVYQNIKEETGKEDIPAALIAGGFNAALDTVLPVQLLKKIRGQGLSEKEVMAAWYKRGAKGLGKGFLTEGATEAAQEASSILAENFVAENSDVFNGKNLERVINAGIKGGLGGGVITAATDIATGKAPPPEQTDRQRIEQLQREILGDVQTARSEKALEEAENAKKAAEDAEAARKEAERAPTVPELITIAQGQNAYSALEAEKQRLLGQEKKTKEVKEAIEVIKELQGRLVIEDVTRRAPSVPAEMDDKTIRSLGFVKSENPESVYQQLLGKSTRDPDVTAFLKNYAETKAKPQTKDRINTFLGRVERAQIPLTAEEIAEGERRAGETVTEPSGAGAPVVGEPGAGAPAAGVGVPQPSGVVPPVAPVGEPPVGERAAPAPVAPPPVTPPAAPPVEAAAPPAAPPVAPPAELLISLPPRLQNITPAERDLYNFNQSLVEAQTPITGFDFERISDAPSPDGRGMTPESLVLSLEGTLGAVKNLDGKLRSKNRTGATVSQLIDQWKTASQIQARINQSKQNNPELWSNYATRQKELGGLKVGDLIQIETGEIGKLDAKFPKNWRIVFDESTPGILAGTKLLRPKEALRPAPAPPSAPAEAAIAASKAPSERQERIAFGKAIGAAQQYPGTLTARVNIPAQTAVTQNDFPGVVAALQKSKSPVVAEVANRARGLNTNIVIDEEAAETYAGKSPVMQQLSIDGAKMHIDALEKIRRLASQVDALPNGAVLPYSIIGETIPGIENGEQVGNISLEKLADMGTTMFAQFPGFKLRTKEDFKALQKAFEDTTSDLGENKIRMTSTGSAETIGVSGVYDANTNTIRVPSYFAKNEGVLAHEIVHAQTVQAVANPSLRQKPVVIRLNKLYGHVKAELEAKAKAEDSAAPYGVASVQEFIAEGMSNPRFQFQLSKIKYKNTTAWDAFVETIANLLGLKKDTAFTELLAIYSELVPPPASDVTGVAPTPVAASAPTPAPAAPIIITAEQLINFGVKKTQPMIRRIAGKNMDVQADRALVLAELNKYINNKDNSPESRENLAKFRDQFEEVGKTVTVAPTKKRKPQQTVMESAMLGRINMVGGLDLSLLSEFSEKKEIGVLGKDDRPLTRWINPMTDKGKLFRSGGMQDYGEIARVLEESGYLEPGSVERDSTEAGERAKRMILSALRKEDAGQTISELEEEARLRQEDFDKQEQAKQEELKAEQEADAFAERQAIIEAEGLTPADLDALEGNIPFLTDAVEQTPERLAADMRDMGFTEEEIADAVTEFSRKAVAAQAPEARAEEAPQAPAAPKAAEELELEAPTAEELAARQKREEDAREAERAEQKRLEQKGRADAERGEFVLTGSDRPADVAAAAGQMDIFGKPSLPEVTIPKPVKLSKETQAKIDELSGLLQKMLGKMGLKNVALNLAQDLERNGEYANRLITLALDATNPVRDLRHESIHAMKELGFFTDAQWDVLTKMARDKWIDKYLKNRASVYEGQPMSRYDAYMRLYNGNEDLIIEEAIADAFGDFDATKAPPGLMQAILFRMREFFRNIRESMGLANIDSAEDIFRRVEKGELKETAPAVEAPAKPSLKEGVRQKGKWYADATPQQQDTLDRWEDERVGGSVSNWQNLDIRAAQEDIYDSASAHFYNYEKAPGLFEIPISDIGPLVGYDNAKDKARIQNLAEQIKESGEIEPVFVAVDPNGEAYLMEGQHRSRALELLGYKAVPARVVVSMDHEEQPITKASLRAPETEAFKRWFGDSKIVDENGKPVPVYHATRAPKTGELFSQFRLSDDGKLGEGIYASSIPEYAEGYSIRGPLMPLWASIENPFVINIDSKFIEYETAPFGETEIPGGRKYPYISSEKPIKEQIEQFVREQTRGKKLAADLMGDSLRQLFEKAGYDGVVVKDDEGNFLEVNAFRPEQIKSATGNIGTYDITKPDIRYSLREVPLSTRGLMEVQPIVAMQELGLKTDAVRKPGGIELFNDVRSIALALNQETIRNHGQIAKTDTSLTSEKELARAMVDEIGYQLRATADTGTGWYSDNYPKAVKKLGKLFPELETNPYARTVFSALVAITSNGEKVSLNVKNAIKLYEDIRMGKDPRNIGFRRKNALDNNVAVVMQLMQQYGPAGMRNELLREITVKDMNAILRARGEKPDTSYLADAKVPAAALYFGPKLGAFFSNLEGAEGYLTMDMWWTRTVNRMRGQLESRATEASIKKFAEMMDKPNATRDEVVAATIPLRNKYEEFGWHTELEELVGSKEPAEDKNKPAWTAKAKRKAGSAYQGLLFEHRLEKMANTIYKNEYEMLQELPFTAKDREFMYRTARRAQSLLKAEGINLSLADIQAALWYYEKRLYQHLSGRKADDIGYDEAITQLARESTGPARPSVVFAGQPVPGAGPTGTGAAATGVGGKPAKPSLRDVEGMPTIGPKMDGTFLRRMENIRQQIGDAYISGEIDSEEFHKRYAATNEEYVNALFVQKKIDEAKPAAGLEEVFPGFVFIPEGTKVLATSGLSYPEPTEATVVGAQDIRIGAKAYKLPVVDFGDGRQRRLAYGDVKEVFAPRPVKPSLRDASWSDERIKDLLDAYAYTMNDAKTKAYAGWVSPADYLAATTPADEVARLEAERRPLDVSELAGQRQPIMIFGELSSDRTWKTDGHEGRHRMMALRDAGVRSVPVVFKMSQGVEAEITTGIYVTPQRWGDIRAQKGFLVGLTPISYKFHAEIERKFGKNGDIKFSLRDVPRANLRDQLNITTLQRIEQTTVAREEKGFVQRITEAISPKNFGFFRQQALNRYEGLSRADRMKIEQMGGVDLLADAGAESAALLSDMGAGVTASALGVHDRKGGAPVYNHYFVVEVNNRALAKRYTSKAQAQAAASAVNGVVRERGYVTVSNFNDSVKGPVLIFAPLMEKYKDPMIFQAFQFYSAAKRGARFMYTLDAKGNVIEKLFTADDINIELPRLEAQFPEFKTVHAEWIKYNDKLVDYMRDTGVISEQNAQTFKMHGDYFPFYRQIDGQDDALGPRIFQSISAVKPPKKLKGSELALGDFLENIVRNTQSAVQAGVKNVAARRAAQVGMDVGIVSEIAPGVTPESANSFYVLENGLKKFYETTDHLFIDSIKSLNLPDMPFIGMLAGPANLLRNLVTKDPGFILANLMRDSMSAWATSGVKMTPIVDTMRNFAGALVNQNPEYRALLNAGVIGGYEFSQNIQTSGKEFGAAIRKTAGVPTFGEKIAKPFTSVWETLEKATTASDAATRMEIYKRTLAETGNEAEAIFRALEVMNFNRKGSSAVIRILTAAVPFLNARMQGLDILYRAAIAPTVRGDTSERARQIQKAFFVRGAYLMALSAMYWLLTHDDEDYKKQEQETRDNYWLLPSLGIKIPIPFEVGVLFKVIPERILAYTLGTDTGKDFADSMKRQLISTLAFNPIPQTVLPLVETVTNFSFFTWRPIIPQGLENVAPEYQVGPGTSKLAEGIGKTLKLSPMKIDQIINGYTGTMGMYAVDLMDSIYNTMAESPKPSKRFEQMPVIRRFAVDPEARGTVTAYYDLKNAVDQVVRTENLLERTMDYENWGPYMQENMKLLASKDYVSDMEKTLKELREMKTLIRASTMSADAKRDAITQIGQMENALTANIQQLKKMFRE